MLRLALYLVLNTGPGSLTLAAPDCSSWTLISRGTSLRNAVNCFGNLNLSWIRGANLMISRSLCCKVSQGSNTHACCLESRVHSSILDQFNFWGLQGWYSSSTLWRVYMGYGYWSNQTAVTTSSQGIPGCSNS